MTHSDELSPHRLFAAIVLMGAGDDEALIPFGYFTPRLLQAAHDEAVGELILPGLDHLGIQLPA